MRGSATFTTVTSSWIMNVATHISSKVHRRRRVTGNVRSDHIRVRLSWTNS